MAEKNFKAPPVLTKDITYNTWKKELEIWKAFTSIDKKKQAPAIFLTLSGQAREAVSENFLLSNLQMIMELKISSPP